MSPADTGGPKMDPNRSLLMNLRDSFCIAFAAASDARAMTRRSHMTQCQMCYGCFGTARKATFFCLHMPSNPFHKREAEKRMQRQTRTTCGRRLRATASAEGQPVAAQMGQGRFRSRASGCSSFKLYVKSRRGTED